MKRKLVDFLVNEQLVDRQDIQRCVLRAEMDEQGSVVDEMTEHLNIDQRKLAMKMAEYWGLEVWSDGAFDVDPSAIEFISEQRARSFGVLPVRTPGSKGVKIAVYDVDKARPVVEEIREKTGTSPSLVLAPRSRVQKGLENHYSESSGKPKPSPTPARGVLRKKKSKDQNRANRTTVSGGDGPSPGARPPQKPTAQAAPTRQVQMERDNPFMDLAGQANDKSPSKKTRDVQEESRSVDDEDEPDFFSAIEESSQASEVDNDPDSELIVDDSEPEPSQEPDDLAGALEDFDDELAAEQSDGDEPELIASESAVNWDEYRDSKHGAFPGLDVDDPSEATQDLAEPSDSPGAATTGAAGAGVFPDDNEPNSDGGFLDFPSTGEEEELTLAEIVDRQRRMIRNLEKEVEYQKGILQTMAELLVEARVLSKRQLRSRLQAFREKARHQYDD